MAATIVLRPQQRFYSTNQGFYILSSNLVFLHKSSKQEVEHVEGFCRGLIRSDVKRGQSGRGKVSDKGSVGAREGPNEVNE